MSNALLKAALQYATQGWPVIPCQPLEKRPLTSHGVKDATTDPAMIRAWWEKWPTANVAVATGRPSGLWVLDVDGREGDMSLSQLEHEHSRLITEVLVKTPNSGRHLYFVLTPGVEIGNRTGIRPGLDVRGTGGYVLVPPSTLSEGEYRALPSMTPILTEAPLWIVEIMKPTEQVNLAEDTAKTIASAPRATESPDNSSVVERARRYLAECAPAIQGSGGHNALLWAARALVVGFQLDDGTVLALLWSEYNPRCSPPWDRGSRADVKDFERKVTEARNTPGEKPAGWLLDEYGLRSGAEALAQIAQGRRVAAHLLGKPKAKPATPAAPATGGVDDGEDPEPDERPPFPLHCFPASIRDFIEMVADVQIVEPGAVGLLALVAGGSVMGNAFWLEIKRGFVVPPVLWGVVIGRSGSNKSGLFREVIKPLHSIPPINRIENPVLSPQGQLIIEDTTTEAVIDVLSHSPRGLCLANPELSGWVGSFDRYVQSGKTKAGGDESVWLKLWDGDSYQKNRKTDSENVSIERAAVSVIGCIQPQKMAECFDPSKFASGLVPRLLVYEIPRVRQPWSEREMTKQGEAEWFNVIEFLRTRPFANFDSNKEVHTPNFLRVSEDAKSRYVEHHEDIEKMIETHNDEWVDVFAGKAKGMAARLALVLHGFGAATEEHDVMSDVSESTMRRGVELARYFLDEQLRLYGLAAGLYKNRQLLGNLAWIKEKKNDPGRTTARELQKHHSKRYAGPGGSERARKALQEIVNKGLGKWDEGVFVAT